MDFPHDSIDKFEKKQEDKKQRLKHKEDEDLKKLAASKKGISDCLNDIVLPTLREYKVELEKRGYNCELIVVNPLDMQSSEKRTTSCILKVTIEYYGENYIEFVSAHDENIHVTYTSQNISAGMAFDEINPIDKITSGEVEGWTENFIKEMFKG